MPYFVREQTASLAFRRGTPEAHKQAARRNGQIHHRTETYKGFSDLELTAAWRTKNIPLLGEGSVFRFSLGTTIPVGDTENDPWVLGDRGLEHLHIQFGNGTFDPVLDAYIGAPINQHFAWGVYSKARLPFYRNHRGYRGSPELTCVPRLTWLPTERTSVTLGASAIYYGYSSWESGRDRSSGQFSALANLGVGYKVTDSLTANASVLIPFYTDSFSTEDSMDPAPTVSFTIGFSF